MLTGIGSTRAQTLDISSGGAPTITGSVGGSVTGSANVLNNLTVTVNFGEVSPVNPNNIVKVTVPIAIRSTVPYRIDVSYTGATGNTLNAILPTDVGFGLRNLRSMGANARVCTLSNHLFYAPFSNDPATSVSIAPATGRAQYPSTFNDIGGGATTIMSGPRLSSTATAARQTNNGYIFDAIFALTPQYYQPGVSSALLNFTITTGPNVPC